MASKIRKGDVVVVVAGKDLGKRGEVLRVDPKGGTVLVQGVNPTRVGFRFRADGTKERYAKKSGTTVDVVSQAKGKGA
jgi:large subunit ribosomal protein L24